MSLPRRVRIAGSLASAIVLYVAGGVMVVAGFARGNDDPTYWLFAMADHPPRSTGQAVPRSRAANRVLLGSRVLRPVYLALWLPNGLVVGCEALIVPYAGERAGVLFAATAVGMLAGDVAMGRFVPPAWHDRLVEPARLLLTVPWLLFFLQPGVVTACLPRRRRLGRLLREPPPAGTAGQPHRPRHPRARAGPPRFGMMSMQGIGALVAGLIATLLGADAHAAGVAISLMAVASVAVTLALTPGLRRSRADLPVEVLSLPGTLACR